MKFSKFTLTLCVGDQILEIRAVTLMVMMALQTYFNNLTLCGLTLQPVSNREQVVFEQYDLQKLHGFFLNVS